MKIIELPDPRLKERSQEVTFPLTNEDLNLISEMIKYIDDSQKPDAKVKPGMGIAAVQMGILKRMIYINIVDTDTQISLFRDFLINPTLKINSKRKVAFKQGEGCLSVGDEFSKTGLVKRFKHVTIHGFSYLKQSDVTYSNISGFISVVFQHEMDHLDGKLYVDRIDEYPHENLGDKDLI